MGIVFKASADIQDLSVWTEASGSPTISNTTARTGTYSYRSAYRSVLKASVPARVDYYVKFGIRSSAAENGNWVCFRENGLFHLSFRFDFDAGNIRAIRGETIYGTVIGTSSGIALALNTWYCVEVYGKIDNSVGIVTVKINGTTVLDLTGQDTQNAGTATINNIYTIHENASTAMYLDDFVIRDDTWPGTGGLYLLTADGDGSDTGWTASAGQRWECIDEVPPSATDYISTDTGTPNTKNTFTFSNLGITPSSIASVSVLVKAKLSAAGTGNIRAIVKSGTTYGNGASTALDVTETWAALHALVNPDTSSAWDLTGVNAISAGVETL